MKRIRMALGLVLLLSCGPSNLPENPLEYFERAIPLTSKKLQLEKELHGYVGWCMVYNHPYIITTESNNLHGKMLYLIDLEQKKLNKFLNYGFGDCESNLAVPFQLDIRKNELLILDNLKEEFKKVYLDSLRFGNSSYKYCPTKFSLLNNKKLKGFFHIAPINDDYFMGYRNELSDSMYSIYNIKEQVEKHALSYPNLEDFAFEDRKEACSIFTGELHVAPNQRKIALISQPTLIDILKFNDGQLNRIRQMEFYRYKFELDRKYGGASSSGYDNVAGFLCGDVTNQYIYVGYDGQRDSAWENISTMKKEYHLLVFDWEGNPVKYFMLDRHIMNFVVKEDDSGILAISRDGEGPELLQYDFNI